MSAATELTPFEKFKAYYAERRLSFKSHARRTLDELILSTDLENFEFSLETGPNNWDDIYIRYKQGSWIHGSGFGVAPFTRHHNKGVEAQAALLLLGNSLPDDNAFRHTLRRMREAELTIGETDLVYHQDFDEKVIYFKLTTMNGLLTLIYPLAED